jgi:hypothetical protein
MEKYDIPPENSDKLLSGSLIPYSKYCDMYATDKTGSSSDDWIH